MSNAQVWEAILSEFEVRLSKANFTTWFKNTAIKSLEDGHIVICVPNNFAKAWFEKKYHHEILTTLERITGQPIQKIEYKVESMKALALDDQTEQFFDKPQEKPASPATRPSSNLNPRYVFESFIIGKGNELAVAAARAVADRPGEAYNPLFVYGPVGLGKTHILQAIGHEILKHSPDKKVLYTTIEKFKNDLVDGVRSGNPQKIKEIYRNVDVLLIDDIQFISGKEGTQEEMFHTFNDLHQQNKQLAFSSDRPPKAIPALEERLRTRFEWGMIVDVTPPDIETRAAIVLKKAEERGVVLPNEIVHVIVTTFQSNIRELESAVNKIVAFHQLKNLEFTPETVRSILSNLESGSGKKSATPKSVLKAVCDFYDVALGDLMGESREKRLSFPRQVVMFLLREDLKLSFPAIGDELGGRDHTTAMHAHSKIKKGFDDDLRLRNEIELIRQRLFSSE